MNRSEKSEELKARLETLDLALVASSSSGQAEPVARKIDEGSDRHSGYPHA